MRGTLSCSVLLGDTRHQRSVDAADAVLADKPTEDATGSFSVLDKCSTQLSAWLKAEETKARKQRRNLKQIYSDLEFEMDSGCALPHITQAQGGKRDGEPGDTDRTFTEVPHVSI